MADYEEFFNKLAKELDDPDLYGCVPAAIVEPGLLLYAEKERKEAKELKRLKRRERKKKK